jgi:hypothetical protein
MRVTSLSISALLAVIFVGLAGCMTAPPSPTVLGDNWQLQDAAKTTAPGDVISQPDYPPQGWYNATVPGTVLTSLVNDSVYPEPLYGENNRRIPDSLALASYCYRDQFTIPANFTGRRVWLNFDGINYIGRVWVNGRAVGEIKGAFARGAFDITSLVNPGGTSAVAVQILPPPHPGSHPDKTIQAGTGPNGGILAEDGPTFLCTIGWDWIPPIRDRDIGIWQKVFISATGPVVLRDPLVASDLPLPRTDHADLTVRATLLNATDAPQTGVLRGAVEGLRFSLPETLAPRETRAVAAPMLRLAHPRLWWPNGYGPQNLCNLHLSFDIGSATSDETDVTFGIRKITYRLPGSDNLAICVNGVPIFCKGGDWGMDEAMKRIPRDRLEAEIRMHQQAHLTMIRSWVGQSTSDDFYDLCDRCGILIWDEFFQPNPSDGPNPLDDALYLANVREKVLRFRNHPSIALWCGRNEGDPPPVIDRGIRQIMDELEPSRLYQASSTDGRGVRSGGPYSWRTPREFYNFRPAEAFKTELGSVSIPTLESIQAMMPPRDWNTINDDWAGHDLTRGAQEGRRIPMYADMLAARYGRLVSLADFVRKAQLANYEAYRAMYEGRQAKMFAPVTGVLTWMSNPAQPSFVWQLYSHDLEPNASLFAVAKACEPVHIQMNQNNFHVMVINNLPQPLARWTADVRVFNLDGSLQYQHHQAVSAAASSAADLGAIAFPCGLSAVHFVKVELRDSWNSLVSDNFYWRALPDHSDDFTALQTLKAAPLDLTVTRRDDQRKCRLEVRLSNRTSVVALAAHLQLRGQATGRRILPVEYSDNYISLLPGESRRIWITAAAADLAGETPLIAVDGWNVRTAARSFSGVNVAENTPALVDPDAAGSFNAQ